MRNSGWIAAVAVVLAIGIAGAGIAEAQATKVYRWVDDKGQVHYGDSIPPEYATQDSEVLNRHGVAVSRIEGNETPEEARTRQEFEQKQKDIAQQRQRDRVLLQTYLSVQEIEALRDRRLDLIDSQIRVQQQYLSQLRLKHGQQLSQASKYKPYNRDPAAEPVPPDTAADIARSEADIRTQQANLQKQQADRKTLQAQFERDIVRYKELRGIKTEAKPATAAPAAAAPAAAAPTKPAPAKAAPAPAKPPAR